MHSHLYSQRYLLLTRIVRVAGLTAQLVAILVVVAQTPVVCVVLAVLAFMLGIIEGGVTFRAHGL